MRAGDRPPRNVVYERQARTWYGRSDPLAYSGSDKSIVSVLDDQCRSGYPRQERGDVVALQGLPERSVRLRFRARAHELPELPPELRIRVPPEDLAERLRKEEPVHLQHCR